MTTNCPTCGWPLHDLPASAHHTSQGRVDYRRCVCGTWHVQINGTTIALTRTRGEAHERA